ncbi:hypothetical protein U1Q18_016315 [Sarracenia purpurea var. burkii]
MGFSGRRSPERRAAATVVGFEGLSENLEDESSLCFGPQSRGKCVVDDGLNGSISANMEIHPGHIEGASSLAFQMLDEMPQRVLPKIQ